MDKIVIPDNIGPQAAPSTPDTWGPPPEVAPKETKAAVEPATPAEVAKEIRKLKLKVDGKEEELTEDEVLRLASLGKSSNQRFQEAAATRRQVEQFLDQLQRDPKSVLTNPKLGIDFKKIAEEYLYEQIQEQALTPEQKKQRDIERELAKYKDQEKKAQQEAEAKQAKELQNRYEADYEKRIMSALEQGGVPKTRSTVRRMAYYLQQSIKNNLDLEPADLVARVRQDYIEEQREMYAAADGDSLLSILGEDLAKKIRDSDVKRLKSTQATSFQTPSKKPANASKDKNPRKVQGSDWKAQMIKEVMGK